LVGSWEVYSKVHFRIGPWLPVDFFDPSLRTQTMRVLY
jgi:hypothetical protein